MLEKMNIAQVRKLSKYTMFLLMNVVLKYNEACTVGKQARFHDKRFLRDS